MELVPPPTPAAPAPTPAATRRGWYDVSKQNNLLDGRWRAVPWGLTGNAIAYRQHWLKEGANTDTFAATWDDFTSIGAKVKQATNTFVGQALGHSFVDPPTSDSQAIGILEAARQAGKRVPQDLAVVGYNDIEVAAYLRLTTVHIPMREMGRRGVALLLQHIERPDAPLEHVTLPAELVVRRSSRA